MEREEDRRRVEARTERERAVMRLSEAASAAFAAALLAPAEPGPRLRRAAERYQVVMGGWETERASRP
jgi:uncharacterized protein (DUF1778 family)